MQARRVPDNLTFFTQVDAQGYYTIGGLTTGEYYVLTNNYAGYMDELFDDVPCPGSACDVSAGTKVLVQQGETTTGIDFALGRGGTVAGHVTVVASGTPLTGVYVQVYSST